MISSISMNGGVGKTTLVVYLGRELADREYPFCFGKSFLSSSKLQDGAGRAGAGKVQMPKPELYVIYTKHRAHKPEQISLSKEFFEGEEPLFRR